MSKQTNEAIVQEITQKFAEAKGAVLIDYRGLTVNQDTELRKKLRAAGVDYRVYKNTLLSIAAKNQGIEGLDQYLAGPTAIAFGMVDAVAAPKILRDAIKDFKKMEIKGGVLDNK
ncbi:MAG TPA: 50S ribosomal protein L10, partial [Bacillota bacterium]|nr:50S ribosomal protein L10 [Bacillota bacterium]